MEVIHQQILIENTMVIMSSDMFSKIHELQSDWEFIIRTIKLWARQFVDELIALGYGEGNEVDFIFELEKFEEREFKKLAKDY